MTTPRVNVQAAVRALPRAHAQVLRGALCGFDDNELAKLVGVPPESIRPLVRLAAAKLGSLLAEAGTDRSSLPPDAGRPDAGPSS